MKLNWRTLSCKLRNNSLGGSSTYPNPPYDGANSAYGGHGSGYGGGGGSAYGGGGAAGYGYSQQNAYDPYAYDPYARAYNNVKDEYNWLELTKIVA